MDNRIKVLAAIAVAGASATAGRLSAPVAPGYQAGDRVTVYKNGTARVHAVDIRRQERGTAFSLRVYGSMQDAEGVPYDMNGKECPVADPVPIAELVDVDFKSCVDDGIYGPHIGLFVHAVDLRRTANEALVYVTLELANGKTITLPSRKCPLPPSATLLLDTVGLDCFRKTYDLGTYSRFDR